MCEKQICMFVCVPLSKNEKDVRFALVVHYQINKEHEFIHYDVF